MLEKSALFWCHWTLYSKKKNPLELDMRKMTNRYMQDRQKALSYVRETKEGVLYGIILFERLDVLLKKYQNLNQRNCGIAESKDFVVRYVFYVSSEKVYCLV